MIDKSFWRNKKVLVTGHTGFKGSWLCTWLIEMGAEVIGYSLKPPTNPSLFEIAGIGSDMKSIIGDIRDFNSLHTTILNEKPEIIFHMAAQPLVRESYKSPAETYATNVMGTVNLLEAVRLYGHTKVVVNITTDKCYENKEWYWGYRENEAMGGYDPYSNSKACSELVTSAYRNSFFQNAGTFVATARAGNVIGGGDWALDRLIPDCLHALLENKAIMIRNPNAIRPWQHVLEPLSGYLVLAQYLFHEGSCFAEGWNFGPNDNDVKPVKWIVSKLCEKWEGSNGYRIDDGNHPHEATYLKLDCSKAKARLNWYPRWSLEQALDRIIDWTLGYKNQLNIRKLCTDQIRAYEDALTNIDL